MEEWSKEYEDLIYDIKKKREEIRRNREWTGFTFPIIRRVFANTLAYNLVSVQPMSSPNMNLIYFDESEEDRRKREIYERRKRIVDKLLEDDKNNI